MREKRKNGSKDGKRETCESGGKERGDVKNTKKRRGERQGKERLLQREYVKEERGCQAGALAVGAELTKHGISNAVKLENARQQSRLGLHGGKNCLVGVRD